MNKDNDVKSIYAPTEYDLQGYCPHCGADVMKLFNAKYCGACRKRIIWNIPIDQNDKKV